MALPLLRASSELPRFRSFDYKNKKVLVRVDINVPIDVEKRVIRDDFKIRAHAVTIRKLIDEGAAVVVISHQGRPGKRDFTSLDLHAELLSKHVNHEVRFVNDVIGERAVREIERVGPGEVLLLDNVRLVKEEMEQRDPKSHSEGIMVRTLAPHFDYFVLDAYAAIHRSHESIVGFPYVLPSCMGCVMESEIDAVCRVLQSSRDKSVALIAGGAKISDSVEAIRRVLENNTVSKVLVGGFVGAAFTAARIGMVGWYKRFVESERLQDKIAVIRRLLEKYGDRIVTPDDQVVKVDGGLKVVSANEVDGEIMDIGYQTVSKFVEVLKAHEVSVMVGPLGYVEDDRFMRGTAEVLNAMIRYSKFTAIGGGQTVMAARKLNVLDKLSHVSTGGKAFMLSLSGDLPPGVEALLISRSRFRHLYSS